MRKTETRIKITKIGVLPGYINISIGTLILSFSLLASAYTFILPAKIAHSATANGANTGCVPAKNIDAFGTYTNRSIPDCYTLLEPIPCIGGAGTGQDCSNLNNGVATQVNIDQYIGYIFKVSIAIAAGLAVLRIIWGGFEYITSEIPGLKSDAKSTIYNAILGLIFVLASYLILKTIDPRLVEVSTALPPIQVKTQGFDTLDQNTIDALNYAEINRRYNTYSDSLKEAQKLREEGDALMAKSELEPWNREELEKQAQEKYKAAEKADLRSSAQAMDGITFTKITEVERVLSDDSGFLDKKDLEKIGAIKKQFSESFDREIKTLRDGGEVELAKKYESRKEAVLTEMAVKESAHYVLQNYSQNLQDAESSEKARKYAIEIENNSDFLKNVTDPTERAQLQQKLTEIAQKIRLEAPTPFNGEKEYIANYIKTHKK